MVDRQILHYLQSDLEVIRMSYTRTDEFSKLSLKIKMLNKEEFHFFTHDESLRPLFEKGKQIIYCNFLQFFLQNGRKAIPNF